MAWLQHEAVALRSIEPGDEDFSDLQPLRSLLAKKRIVVLGEASHGDGATFLAKTRLIRFLHQQMGFDVLAFESGFYDCWKAWQRIGAGDDPAEAMRQSVFPIWTRSAQGKPLVDYFASSARSQRPLVLAGVDPQFTGEISGRFLLGDLLPVAMAAGMGDGFAARISAPLANLTDGKYELGELPPAAAQAEFLKAFDELARSLRAKGRDIPEGDYWLRFVEGTRQLARNSWATDWKRPLIEDPEGFAVRDRIMGEHLAWLARHRFAGRKIIVWAASLHIARELNGIDTPSAALNRLYRTYRPMGSVARDQLGEELYTVGVLTYQGSSGRWFETPKEIQRPSDGSLEDLFHRTGLPYAFLDLSRTRRLPAWLRDPLIAHPMGFMEMKGRWNRVFDALLFIDRMTPSEKQPKR